MRKILTALFTLIAVSLSSSLVAKEIAGVDLPDTVTVAGESLALNGGGVRSKFFIDLYVGSLYLKQSSTDAEKVVAADESMAIGLAITSGRITSENMSEATREGFDNSTGGNTAPIQEHIEAFIAVFQEEIKEGDTYLIGYDGAGNILVEKNGESKASINGGLEFKKAVFGIWLSKKPAQKSLRDEMMGD